MREWSSVCVALVACLFILEVGYGSAIGREPGPSCSGNARSSAINHHVDLSIHNAHPVITSTSNSRNPSSLAVLQSVFVDEQSLSANGSREFLALSVLLRLDWIDGNQLGSNSSHNNRIGGNEAVFDDHCVCVSLVQEKLLGSERPSCPVRVSNACLSVDRRVQAVQIFVSFSPARNEAYSLLLSEGHRALLVHPIDLQCPHGSCQIALGSISRPPIPANISTGGIVAITSPYHFSFEAVVVRSCDEEYLRFPGDQALRSCRYPRIRSVVLETTAKQPPLCVSSQSERIVITAAATDTDADAGDEKDNDDGGDDNDNRGVAAEHGLEERIERMRDQLHVRLSSHPPNSLRMVVRLRYIHRQLMSACKEKNLRWEMCVELARQLHRALSLQTAQQLLQLPSVQWEPSLARPFVLLHLEKTAGTTLREFIASSARSKGYTSFVPCHNNLSCLSFALPQCGNKRNPACQVSPGRALLELVCYPPTPPTVLAGHFSWGVWEDSPALLRIAHPALLFINRDPVARVISQFYQRCYASTTCNPLRRRLSDWTPTELRVFMQTQRTAYVDEDLARLRAALHDQYSKAGQTQPHSRDDPVFDLWSHLPTDYYEVVVIDEGLSDAACRMILGKKTTTGLRLPYGRTEFQFGELRVNVTVQLPPTALSDEDTASALDRLDAMVVGLQERWEDTVRVVNHFFPWIDFQGDLDRVSLPGVLGQVSDASQHKESASDLGEELRSTILDLNRCDIQLFEKSKRRFAAQLEVLDLEQSHEM